MRDTAFLGSKVDENLCNFKCIGVEMNMHSECMDTRRMKLKREYVSLHNHQSRIQRCLQTGVNCDLHYTDVNKIHTYAANNRFSSMGLCSHNATLQAETPTKTINSI